MSFSISGGLIIALGGFGPAMAIGFIGENAIYEIILKQLITNSIVGAVCV